MPRRVDDFHQPQLAPTASDLGEEAYQANLKHHHAATDSTTVGDRAGVVPEWQSPEARNSPPGQQRKDAQEIKIGRDIKVHEARTES